jgi:hypothetical protein
LCILGSVSIAGLVAGYREAQPLLRAWLEVREVTVYGARHVTQQEVLERLSLAAGETVFSIDPERLSGRLRGHPWIKEAHVTCRFPHTLEVSVRERHAAAVVQTRAVPVLIDEEGHVLALAGEPPTDPLPVLLGIDANALVRGDTAALAMAHAGVKVASLVQSNGAVPSAGLSHGSLQVDLRDPRNVVAFYKEQRFQFGSSAFEEKWDRYRRVEPELHAHASAGPLDGRDGGVLTGASDRRRDSGLRRREPDRAAWDIDLRYEGKVIVRERG